MWGLANPLILFLKSSSLLYFTFPMYSWKFRHSFLDNTVVYLFLGMTILRWKNRNLRFGIAHIIFLNLPAQIKVCSATGVLR